MNHLNRQPLADIYASTHTIAVTGAAAHPDAAVLPRRIGGYALQAHLRPRHCQAYRLGDLVRPGVHINAVREVGKARPESAGSRMAMQGGV